MPRYLIVRRFSVDESQMPIVGRRSREITEDELPEITWEHSHVVTDDDGAIKTYCIYAAPTEEMLREHADAFGAHVITNLYEIVEDVTPEDVRRRAAEVNFQR